MIVNNVRLPIIFWNDVRSLVASNNTGARRLTATLDEFGADTFAEYAEKGDHGGEGRRLGAHRRAPGRGLRGATSRRVTGRSPTCCRSTAG